MGSIGVVHSHAKTPKGIVEEENKTAPCEIYQK